MIRRAGVPRTSRRMGASAGFTLIELLIVMGILAMVLALVIVARPRTTGLRLEAAARALTESMRLARTAAMTRNVETVFVLDTRARRYGIGRATQSLPLGVGVDLTIAEPERDGALGGFRFYPDGQSSGGDVTLSLDGATARIAVNWLTGRAVGEPVSRPRLRRGHPRGRTAGFALIEALVAFAILSIALGALMSGIAAGLRADRDVAARRVALRTVQARLARLGVADPLVPGESEGRTDDGRSWRARVTPAGMPTDSRAAAPSPSAVVAYWAEVTVMLEDGSEVSLGALKLAPPQARPRS